MSIKALPQVTFLILWTQTNADTALNPFQDFLVKSSPSKGDRAFATRGPWVWKSKSEEIRVAKQNTS